MHDNSGNEAFAAEIVASIVDECFEHLDAPVRRADVRSDALSDRVRDLAEF
jgi:pyruvate/2-oxoglutarate/acetoin dehydrogenase E1 component